MKRIFFASVFLLTALSINSFSQPAKPEFVSAAMNGEKVDTRALRGKVVVLNLWFINCPNCLAEIKMLNALVDEYKADSDVVFLAPAASSKNELAKFLAKNPFKYQVIPDAANIILGQFGTPDKDGEISIPFPMHVVLDREGNVAVKAPGMKGIEAVRSELKKQSGIRTN
ncbi:MAG: TlpA disulfide reductase family protein [Pyrinomonadaceae bacterium]